MERDNTPETGQVKEDIQGKARKIVLDYVNTTILFQGSQPLDPEEVYVVWFSKTLQNWKALVSTNLRDGRYYELTYNGDRCETYLDVYEKQDNVLISDLPNIHPPYDR